MVIVLLLAAFPPGVAHAQEDIGSYVEIIIHYRSMFPGNIQVRDEVCTEPRSLDCEKARIKVNGPRCRQQRSVVECQEAKALLQTTFCVEGLVYEGRMSQGEEVRVKVCKSYAGYGSVSVRDTNKGTIWTNYALKTDNSKISFP